MVSIRKSGRPKYRGVRRVALRDELRFTTRNRYLENSDAAAGPISSEDDRAAIVPCSASAAGCVAQDLDGTAARINALQLERLEEAHLTTIR